MHAELLDLVFTGATSALLIIGGGAALLALPWREREMDAGERALGTLGALAAHAMARVRLLEVPAEVPVGVPVGVPVPVRRLAAATR